MELYQLRQFAAVAKYENMTRAAESLNVAQPLYPKPYGIWKASWEPSYSSERERDCAAPSREISCCGTYGRYWKPSATHAAKLRRACTGQAVCASVRCRAAERISEILAGFSAEYGNLDLRISSTPEGSDLLLDSAVSRDEVPAGAVLLYDEEMCVAVPEGHRYADRESVSLTELADDPFIALSNSQSFRQISEHIFRSAGMEMARRYRVRQRGLADPTAVVRHGCCTGRVR